MLGVSMGACTKKQLNSARDALKNLLLPARFTFVTIVKLGAGQSLEAYMVCCYDIRAEDQIIEFRKKFSIVPADRELVELYVATKGCAESMRKAGDFTITGAFIQDLVSGSVLFEHTYE